MYTSCGKGAGVFILGYVVNPFPIWERREGMLGNPHVYHSLPSAQLMTNWKQFFASYCIGDPLQPRSWVFHSWHRPRCMWVLNVCCTNKGLQLSHLMIEYWREILRKWSFESSTLSVHILQPLFRIQELPYCKPNGWVASFWLHPPTSMPYLYCWHQGLAFPLLGATLGLHRPLPLGLCCLASTPTSAGPRSSLCQVNAFSQEVREMLGHVVSWGQEPWVGKAVLPLSWVLSG